MKNQITLILIQFITVLYLLYSLLITHRRAIPFNYSYQKYFQIFCKEKPFIDANVDLLQS